MEKKSVIEQIEALVSSARPEDLSGIQTLEQIKADLEKRAQQAKRAKSEKLQEVSKLMGMQDSNPTSWVEFCELYLRSQGYKTISKRKLGGGARGGKRKVNTVPITDEIAKEARKLYGQSKFAGRPNLLAKELKVNLNSLKKLLGIPRSMVEKDGKLIFTM
jgi:hypothetical protein